MGIIPSQSYKERESCCMPIYEYTCEDCFHDFEVMQKMSEEPVKACPACGKERAKKLVSAPNFKLKGTGWYETDFKDKPKKKESSDPSDKKDSKDTKNVKESKDSKSESKKETPKETPKENVKKDVKKNKDT